jgi:hypothetical protein
MYGCQRPLFDLFYRIIRIERVRYLVEESEGEGTFLKASIGKVGNSIVPVIAIETAIGSRTWISVDQSQEPLGAVKGVGKIGQGIGELVIHGIISYSLYLAFSMP